jgi:hypothetical protein
MSTNSVVLNNGQQAIINTDLSKIFVWNNRYESALFNNPAYDPVTIPAGTLMGRVAATGWIKEFSASASDGTQFVVGVLADDYTVEDGELKTVVICTAGDVVESQIILQSPDTMNTTVTGRSRRVRDCIASDPVGIKLVGGTEHTYYDNQ